MRARAITEGWGCAASNTRRVVLRFERSPRQVKDYRV